MTEHEPSSELDAQVRRLLAPDAAAVRRVVAHVLQTATARRQPPRRRAWAIVFVSALALTIALLWREPQSAPTPASVSTLTITGSRAAVVVERPVDGRRWAVLASERGDLVGNYVIVIKE